MRLLLNILTETQGLWAPLLILELFDPEFRALFKVRLAKVCKASSERLPCFSPGIEQRPEPRQEKRHRSLAGEDLCEFLEDIRDFQEPVGAHLVADNIGQVGAGADGGM